jgi:hypothetical protein
MIDRHAIEQRWKADGSKRDERGRRVFAASEARAAGRGGVAAVSEITGLARSTIGRGLKELDAPSPPHGRVRRDGGGPRLLTERDPTLLADLERLVEPATLGDPERPLLWVSRSLDKLARALGDMGHAISPNSVRKLPVGLGFSRQVNRKADDKPGYRRGRTRGSCWLSRREGGDGAPAGVLEGGGVKRLIRWINRSRNGKELPLPGWKDTAEVGWLEQWAMTLMPTRVATRKVGPAVRLPEAGVPAERALASRNRRFRGGSRP